MSKLMSFLENYIKNRNDTFAANNPRMENEAYIDSIREMKSKDYRKSNNRSKAGIERRRLEIDFRLNQAKRKVVMKDRMLAELKRRKREKRRAEIIMAVESVRAIKRHVAKMLKSEEDKLAKVTAARLAKKT